MAVEFNSTDISQVIFNNIDVDNVYFNGVLVFSSGVPVEDSNLPQLLPFNLYGIQHNQDNPVYPYSNTIYLT